MLSGLKRLWLHSEFNESAELLAKKLDDHRQFSGNVFLFGAFLCASLWIWDYVTDPAGAEETVLYRLVFFILLPVPLIIRKLNRPYLLAAVAFILIALTLADYVLILTHLKQGMLYGIGGFMFYMLLPPIAFAAFPLTANVLSILLIAAIPHLLALAGFADGFEHANYAVLIWPGAAIAIIIQYFYAKDYHRRYRLEKALERLSYTDTLSGLYNRRFFMDTFREAVKEAGESAQPLAVMIADIDRFKAINDRYGHPAGDEVIRTLSLLLHRELRAADTVARIGGEEFGVLLPGTGAKEASAIAERLRTAAESLQVAQMKAADAVTISIGIAVFEENDTAETLFKKADSALYRAKRSGRNRISVTVAD